MSILVSGLLNTETVVSVRGFPVPYYPIDYPFFGVQTAPAGVAFNVAKALTTLGERVRLTAMVGRDFAASYVRDALAQCGIDDTHVLPCLRQTPASAVLVDPEGKRQIYCDLKDIQETPYPFGEELPEDIELVAACNINFNRPLLHLAAKAGKTIATDVHVLTDIHDAFNREFMQAADILFLSDEGVGDGYREFMQALAGTYPCRILVMGRGSKGAAIYRRESGDILDFPAAHAGTVVNTVGAGDALFSAFLHFTARGFDPLRALQAAQVFAAHKITVSGASVGFPSEAQVLAAME